MPDEERDENRAEFTRFLESLQNAKAHDDIAGEFLLAHNRLAKIDTQLRVKMERNAWANAIQAVHAMKRKGINPFNGTEQDMQAHVDRALYNYQKQIKPQNADMFRFYRKRQPPLGMEMPEDAAD